MPKNISQVSKLIQESISVKERLLNDDNLKKQIVEIAMVSILALKGGNKIIFCGNGGSFADSIHLSAEFVSRFQRERGPLASIALGANNSILTAVGNDYSFSEVFARELGALGNRGDVLIGISTSGKSENVLRAVTVAEEIGMTAFGFTGSQDNPFLESSKWLKIPSSKTARIQEAHILVGHIICELCEEAMFDFHEEPQLSS
ncbi:SIS domain-containing protein [Planktomarina sp.]|nr:SIS domain-containing protein [Planktomarina sp.]